MNRYFALVFIVASGVLAGATVFAQDGPYQGRPHDEIMKDVQATYRSLGENLEASEAPAVAEDAARLEGLFRETEAFWARFQTEDAIAAARGAREAVAAVAARVGDGDVEAAQESYSAVRGFCGSCHEFHREQTLTGYIIRP